MINHYCRFVRSGCGYLLNWSAFLCIVMLLSSNVKAQNNLYNFTQAPLRTVISQISTNTSYRFVYAPELLKEAKPIDLNLNTSDIQILMDAVAKGQNFSYEIAKNQTILLRVLSENPKEYILHGIVKDSVGGPLPGATVKIKDTNKYTITDGNGHFSLNLTSQYNTLEISYMGYFTATQKFDRYAALKIVTVSLKANSSLLAEVVVNGFQSITRGGTTGAVTIIDEKKLNENINIDILSALEGRVAGLVYNKNPFGLGADQPVLRGQATFSLVGGNAPLVVLDGLPTETPLDEINPYDIESVTVLKDGGAASIYGSRSANGVIVLTTKKGSTPLKISLNTDFFIDTKPTFGSMHYASTADIVDFETDVYNKERARYANTETMFAAYGTVANGNIKYYSPLYQLFRDRDAGKVTTDQFNQQLTNFKNADYYEQYRDNVWQNAFRQRYNLSLSSASPKSNSFASINYDRSAERVIGNNSQKVTLYFKNTYNIKKWLSTNIGFNGAYSTSTSTDGSYDSYTAISPRYASIVNPDGSLVYANYVNLQDGIAGSPVNGAVAGALINTPQYKSYRFNILESLNEGLTEANTVSLRAFANIQAKIMDGLNFSSQIQYEMGTTKSEQIYDVNSYKMRAAYNALVAFTPATNVYTFGLPTGGRISQNMQQKKSYTFRNQLSYDESFDGGKHSIAAIAGTEMRQTFLPIGMTDIRYGYDPVTLTSTIINNQTVSQTGLPSYIFGGNKTLGIAGRSFQETKHRNLSYFSNASYTYLSRYNVSGSFRIDQADFFGADPEFKYRPLWSVGFGWNASNEKFFESLRWINLLKLRATYGVNGNQNTETTKFLTARRVNDNLFTSLQYLNITGLPNPKLRWEKTETYNLGLDMAFLGNRLRGTIDFYDRKSTDLMVTTDLDPTVGTASLVINNGILRNKGIEFTVNGDWLKSGDLSLSSTFVLGFNRSKIGKVNRALATASSYVTSPQNYYTEGTDYNTLYAYRYGGMTNGYPYFLDENGKATLEFDASGNPIVASSRGINNYAALVSMGTLIPTYNGSFSQRVSYKNFELSALLIFSGGNVMRKDVTPLGSNDISDLDITQRYKNGITPELPRLLVDYSEAMIPRALTISSMWQNADINVLKADYVKLRSVSLGYNLPKAFIKKFNIPSAKFTAQVNNLWYASAAGDDIDPESYSLNSGTRTLQNPKSFVLGINLTF
ncbi:SusC/RagA family TonB-linked outer membrane protein [Pedobacter rhizosphaerae]|uniref:TonB-linked outer membrane protein, SusC/RagA family n=1 Tax=Pedobacter rhizosphaerae TaxID=390241 RepID=A0A1H9SUH5_9SPHI|nr:SusC/RagA family TonB-linked outer membrane protein [Pedobacter rhizosphaerae]SER88652.1 TonB-linked outer membrane protein, SusC/RagA family [Pedobacter rhizosphaerae]